MVPARWLFGAAHMAAEQGQKGAPEMHEKGTHTVKQIAEVVGVSCATVHRAVSAS
jgi:hypothetical protein